MNRGLEQRDIFTGDSDAQVFFDLLAETRKRWNLRCHAVCLMNNHYHLLVHDLDGQLSRAMRHIDGVFTQSFNRRHRRDGPLMRGRYRSQLVDSEGYLLEVIRYIHLNPVKARIVARASEYLWSSHRWYLTRRAPGWLQRDAVYDHFGATSRGKAAFDSFVHDRVSERVHATLEGEHWKPILGSRSFTAHWKTRLRAHAADGNREIPEARRLVAATVSIVVEAGCVFFGVAEAQLLACGSGVRNPNRDLVLLACRRYTQATNAQLGKRFGVSAATISTSVRRTQAVLATHAQLRHRYDSLIKTVEEKSKAAT